MVEEVFVAKVMGCGRVTIPLGVRDVSGLKEGYYVRLSLIEVIGPKKKIKRGMELQGGSGCLGCGFLLWFGS